ncbi:High-affinity gluconate transporter GntT [Klebsiella pneumoniae]|uniref:High-affinity gluconate transporter GntT n=1 Tax=Klebsiella pneumoniae TaxID=573 RepID=A0A377U197_KLEPN|nr:High-affinity gluconate transporter GntT [Klebsiella pneumoniae]STV97610.1 High-affinity gluconate transporter GntT [Klebsiella pneumoniae]
MPLVIVAIGVALLLLLMIRFKMNGFIALVLVALAVGLMQGMPLDKVIVSIKKRRWRHPWQPRADHGLRRYAR